MSPEIVLEIIIAIAIVVMLVVILLRSPTKLKGSLKDMSIEAEWRNADTGAIAANVQGRRIVYLPSDLAESLIPSTESAFGDVQDAKTSYIGKAMDYARVRLESVQHDIAAYLRHATTTPPETECGKGCEAFSYLDDALTEMKIKLAEAVTAGMTAKLLEYLKGSFEINGFYDMQILDPSGARARKAEWGIFIQRQTDLLQRMAKHYLGNKLTSTWRMTGEQILQATEKNHDYWLDLTDGIYDTAWEHQHHYKVRQKKYREWKTSVIKSIREEGALSHVED